MNVPRRSVAARCRGAVSRHSASARGLGAGSRRGVAERCVGAGSRCGVAAYARHLARVGRVAREHDERHAQLLAAPIEKARRALVEHVVVRGCDHNRGTARARQGRREEGAPWRPRSAL
eukprot:6644978-Prymnesium_polylepis.2